LNLGQREVVGEYTVEKRYETRRIPAVRLDDICTEDQLAKEYLKESSRISRHLATDLIIKGASMLEE
jgi:hypothetical protein